MAILHEASFDGAVGVITTGNSNFDYVGGAPEIVTGGLLGNCMQANTPTASPAYVQFWLAGSTDTIYQRFYVKPAAVGASMYLCQVFTTTAQTATLSMQSTGALRMRQGTSTTIGDAFTPLLLSTTEWTRVEWGISGSTMQLKMYQGADLHGTTPTYDSGALAWTPTAFNRVGVGSTASVAGVNILVDEYAVGDDWVGSAATAPTTPWQRKTAEGWQPMVMRVID